MEREREREREREVILVNWTGLRGVRRQRGW